MEHHILIWSLFWLNFYVYTGEDSRERATLRKRLKTKEVNFDEIKTWNFIAALRKWEMLAATKVKMRGSAKERTGTHDISSIKHVTRKFHIVVFFVCYLDLLIFLPLTHCRCHSALHNNYFIFCLNIYYNYVNTSFTFSPG